MEKNCVYKLGYLFEEIKILKPKLIFALGVFSFNAIKNEYIDTAQNIAPSFEDWIISFSIDDISTTAVRLYNPPQGYQTPRSKFNKIREGKSIEEQWEKFLPDDIKKTGNREQALENKYPKENRIDPENPFYDAIFTKLISIGYKEGYYAKAKRID